MKKRLLLGLVCTILLGVGGCMEGKKVNLELDESEVFASNFDNEITKKEQKIITFIINDLNDKYKESFKAYHFIPSKKGFNTDASKNYIFAKNNEGLKVYIEQRNDEETTYFDNYKNVNYGQVVEDEFEKILPFEGEISLLMALDDIDLDGATAEEIIHYSNQTKLLLHIPFEITEENISELYEYYSKITKIRPDHIQFLIASGEPNESTYEYMDQFIYYQYVIRWEDFDKNIKQGLFLDTKKQVTLEKFQSFLIEVN